jgi:diguanylate cyclase (GGDEF)-like protein/PAS domain S-box-containing protein
MGCSQNACSTHACDCRTVLPAERLDGVVLVAERQHVRTKVGVLLEQTDGLRLEGHDWPDRLEAILERLSFSERSALLATPLTGAGSAVTLSAEDALLRARTQWLPDLLNGSQLYPHVQPIVSLADGAAYGFEALIRGKVGDRELSGGEIVQAARAHGAIFTLDLVGRTVALEQAMPKLERDHVLFVNFTPTAIYDPQVCLRTTWAIARRLGLPMEKICFEAVETEEFPDLSFLRRILDEYRAQGAMVALDDLGAGHSSLSYLKELRPDIVKLDRELVTGLAEDPSRQRLVGAMIDYAHELDIRVVAEGIETEDDLAAIRALGADLGQGWYLGRPAAEPVVVEPSRITSARTDHALRVTLETRDRALTAATSGVVIADATQPGLPIVYVNPAFERLTGYSASELTGRSCNLLQGEGTDPAAVRQMISAIRESRECRVTLLNFRKDATPFWCEVHLSPVRDAQGRVVQYVGVQNDVSERVRAELQLREQRDRADHLARHDLLTGLPNRQEFAERAEDILDGLAEDETAAVIFIDLDHFKQVNDLYGHNTGDDVLRESARELSELCGPDVLLARQAGDEFLAFFKRPDRAMAAHRAQQLVTAIAEQVVDHDVTGLITASAGASLSNPGRRRTLDQMLADADQAMYVQKGRRNARLAIHS